MRRVLPFLLCAACAHEPFDLVIRGGELYDGTGGPARRVDVGIRGDRIAEIGDLHKEHARRVVDATGLAVAPGFIDVQGQSDMTLLMDGRGESHVRQGITTEILGEGGSPGLWTDETVSAEDRADMKKRLGIDFDWRGFESFLRRFERSGTSINVGSFASADQARIRVLGYVDRPPTPEELAREEAIIDEAMRQGAFGLATALIYPPLSYARTDELLAMARVAARHGGIYISHVRGESGRVLDAIGEALEIGDRASMPVVIYHLKAAGRANWGRMPEIGALIERARARGQEVGASMYPYVAAGTGLAACLPGWAQEGGNDKMLERLRDPAMRARIREEVETKKDGWENMIALAGFEGIQIASVRPGSDTSVQGKRLAHIAAERGKDPWDVFFDLLLENKGDVFCFYYMMSDEDVRTGLRFPWVSIGTDAEATRPGLTGGLVHPRAYGSFPRLLGHYVRDERLLPLAEAIRKSTSLAAAQLGIRERGTVKEGYFADLVVFDPKTVIDTATFEQPHQFPHGIEWVIVNGQVTVEKERHTGVKAGRALFGPGYARDRGALRGAP